MVIVMKQEASSQQIGDAIQRVEGLGYQAHVSRGVERTIIGVVGDAIATGVGMPCAVGACGRSMIV